MKLEPVRYWLIIYESVHPKKRVAVFGADASELDIYSAITPNPEDEHGPHTEHLLQEGGLWDRAQTANLDFSQEELNYLTQGILRRMVLLIPDKERNFAMVYAITTQEPPPPGEIVSERYGIKVWRLPQPIPLPPGAASAAV